MSAPGADSRAMEWESRLAGELQRSACGDWHVQCFEEVDSTMESARTLVRRDGDAPAVILAKAQRQGRGRQGRQWVGGKGNLFATYVVPARREAAKLGGLSLAVGLALARLCERYGADLKVKWPNDLITSDGRKLAGILIELLGPVGAQSAAIGIGVNLVHTPQGVTAISLAEISGKTIEPVVFAAALVCELQPVLDTFMAEGFGPLRPEWMARAAFLGEELAIDTGERIVRGVCRGVSESGSLLLEGPPGMQEISAGHVLI